MNELHCLTRREAEVLRLVSCGHQNKEIARMLGISHGTVGQHLKNIYAKLEVSNRTEASLMFLRRNAA